MSLFHPRKEPERIPYDPSIREPAIRRSICTGEMTAGFVDLVSGDFHDLMLLEDQKAVDEFCRRVGRSEVRTIY